MTLKPSLEEYTELGKEFSFLCARMETLSCKIGQELGVSKGHYKHIREAVRSLQKCRSDAEDSMFQHYPDLPRDATKIFYHKPEGEAEEVHIKSGWQFK